MKILAIGDFHGKFSGKLFKKIKKEDFDIILSPGDYCGNEKLAKLFFKHVYGTDKENIPKKIKKRLEKLDKISDMAGIKIIKKMKKIDKLIMGIRGNWDPKHGETDIGLESEYDKNNLKRFDKLQDKDFQLIDFKLKKLDGFQLIGGVSSTSPGKRNKENKIHYDKRKKKYENVFKKSGKSKLPVIFLTHNCPYRTKLDKIKKGPQKGKHYGSYLEKELIKKYKPKLVICGHIHEGFGKQKVGRTLVVNTGSAREGKAAIIDTDTLEVKFLR
jgi:Icc-related predicted phosphoesterase